MLNGVDEVQGIVSGKLTLRYAGPEIDAMKSSANASSQRFLTDFQKYKKELLDDSIIRAHLDAGTKLVPYY
ncbi:26S proteasome non-ATPase regulatory subunit 11 [Chamberlinius hualienensis]